MIRKTFDEKGIVFKSEYCPTPENLESDNIAKTMRLIDENIKRTKKNNNYGLIKINDKVM